MKKFRKAALVSVIIGLIVIGIYSVEPFSLNLPLSSYFYISYSQIKYVCSEDDLLNFFFRGFGLLLSIALAS